MMMMKRYNFNRNSHFVNQLFSTRVPRNVKFRERQPVFHEWGEGLKI